MGAQAEPAAGFTPYQRRLFVFLSVATFFEGYDFLALAQLLPDLRASMGLTPAEGGALVAFINVGTIVASLLVRQADVWGRKRVMSITIAGYTAASFASGLAPGVVSFAVLQLVARVFLLGEWAVAMVYAAEEFPAARRGMVIGVIQGCSSLGAVACAALVPLLVRAPWGWRTVYFAGAIPLVLVAVARRGLRESARFERAAAARAAGRGRAVGPSGSTEGSGEGSSDGSSDGSSEGASDGSGDGSSEGATRRGFADLLGPTYRARTLQMATLWGLTYVCTQSAITFWKEFALAERAMTDREVGASISIAAVVAMPLTLGAGRLIDAMGRRKGATLIFTVTAASVVAAYTVHGRVALVTALALAIFGTSAVLPVLNAYTAELFPTELRGDAFAWANHLLGRIGYVLAPLAVGALAGSVGWGWAVASTALGPLVALGLIWAWLPETVGRDLDDTVGLH